MEIRKVPLEIFIQILEDLYNNGADFVDISGEMDDSGNISRDRIKLTVKPEYLSTNDDEVADIEQEIEMNYSENNEDDNSLSDKDINDLI